MQQLLESFITLFVIMDPIGNLPLFTGISIGVIGKKDLSPQ